MTDFEALYRKKLTTPEAAVKLVQSGDWVDYGWSCNYPVALDRALAARSAELTDVKVRGGVTLRMPEIFKAPDGGEHFSWHTWHCTGLDRRIVEGGMGFFVPMRYSELPRFYRDGGATADVAMIQTTPMDASGNFSFALSASHLSDMLAAAKKVVVEVNPKMPWVYGMRGCEINVRDVDAVVECEPTDAPVLLPSPEPNEVDKKLAETIAREIPNGACLQLGIGTLPNTVGTLLAQSDLKDLGVHSEMYMDAYVDLTLAGKLTGKNKAIDRGRQVFAFAMGSKRLYDFIDRNPAVMAAPVDYTNDVRVIAQLDNFISINNAVEMDLYGQVNAETSGFRHISGTGGQLDFVLGAYLSHGGKSFVCMSSTITAKDGTLKSRILPLLSKGSVCTDPRTCVQYVVTEYGMVNLKGLATWQRAEAIIALAHPQFREELIRNAEEMRIWRRSNKR